MTVESNARQTIEHCPAGSEAACRTAVLRIRHAAGNLAVAALYLAVLTPGAKSNWGSSLANRIWFVGCVLIGLLTLIRRPAAHYDAGWRSLSANAGELLTPLLMRTGTSVAGPLAGVAIALELAGVVLTQAGRLFMGRGFGLLPANRGVISAGPFGLVRHPIYLGWLILGCGYALYYPRWSNLALISATAVLTIWRIHLEEQLLGGDPEYRAYRIQVPARLIPGLY